MPSAYTLSELAAIVGGTLRGDGSAVVLGVADVTEAGSMDATWVSSPKYAALVSESKAGVVLGPMDMGATPMPAILCEHVDRSVALLLGAFADPVARPDSGIHPTAVVDPGAKIGSDPAIGPHVVIEAGVEIGSSCRIRAGVFIGRGSTLGDDCELWPTVVIRDGCVLGSRVVIHPGAVIGADGLGLYFDQKRHHKVPHIGGVRIGDDVEIGACSCIDRAKFGFTVIGSGTKIDNHVHVGHNVRVGEHCVLAGQTGISGSVRIGEYCVFGGRAGSVDNVTIGDGVRVAGVSTVTKDVASGAMVSGYPAQDHEREKRERVAIRKLPNLITELRSLRARVAELEAATEDNQS